MNACTHRCRLLLLCGIGVWRYLQIAIEFIAYTSFCVSTFNMYHMNPLTAIKTCIFKKPLSFRGTASKSEFWGFALPFALFFLGFPILIACIVNSLHVRGLENVLFSIWGIVCVGCLIPLLSVAIRRLRDTGSSGWMIFIALIPVFGIFILIWLLNGESVTQTQEQ